MILHNIYICAILIFQFSIFSSCGLISLLDPDQMRVRIQYSKAASATCIYCSVAGVDTPFCCVGGGGDAVVQPDAIAALERASPRHSPPPPHPSAPYYIGGSTHLCPPVCAAS
jgi:hypothetical protein